MNILHLDKDRIITCNTFISRLKGMMFHKKENYIYFFPKCNSIHTFFMLKSIDVIMTDKDNNIIKYYKNFKPWKIILPKKKVCNVYEMDSINDDNNFQKIEIN